MNINPYLIARLYTIQAAFAQPGFISSSAYSVAPAPAQPKTAPFNWDDLIKKEDEDGKGGDSGGGGTIKGLRGKNDVAGKAAMRRLGRK